MGLLGATWGSASPGSSPSSTTGHSASSSLPTLGVATVPAVGAVLVDSVGRTLYRLSTDHQSAVTCTASNGCTRVWPPLLITGNATPRTGSGLQSSFVGTLGPSPAMAVSSAIGTPSSDWRSMWT